MGRTGRDVDASLPSIPRRRGESGFARGWRVMHARRSDAARGHDVQQPPPVDQPRQGDKRDPRRVIRASGLCLPFDVQRQLFLEKEVFCRERRPRSAHGRAEPCHVAHQAQERRDAKAITSADHVGKMIRNPRRDVAASSRVHCGSLRI